MFASSPISQPCSARSYSRAPSTSKHVQPLSFSVHEDFMGGEIMNGADATASSFNPLGSLNVNTNFGALNESAIYSPSMVRSPK